MSPPQLPERTLVLNVSGSLPVWSAIRQLDATGWALRFQMMPGDVIADSLNQRDADYTLMWIAGAQDV